MRYVLESSVALVVEQRRTLAFVALRRAIRLVLIVERAVLIGLNRPVDVVRDEKIEFAVVVVVEPDRAGGKSRIGDSSLRGHIGELAVAEIAEQMVRADGGDVEIDVAVVVVVGDSAAQSVHFNGEAGLAGSHR